LFIELHELFKAYFECRRNKRHTVNALAFEVDYEAKLIELWQQINAHTYLPGKSITFIVDKPVKREIFAADFRDRVVHHLLIGKLNPLFEKLFIYDSYACRVNKGTHFGIQRIDRFIRCCSQNNTQDCYILKLDIQGFFMSINKVILWSKLQAFIQTHYQLPDKELVLELCSKIIDNDPTQQCIRKGKRGDWDDLPANKSLFHSPAQCGLPIGNLTSQVFANFYLNAFDHYVKKELGIRYYGRYVDDFVLVHSDKVFLQHLIPKLKQFLQVNLGLTLHPNKIYLQHYSKGVQFLGVVIKPHRIYIANRTKGNFYAAIVQQNSVVEAQKPTKVEKDYFLSSMNSYLGILKHYKTRRLRKKMLLKNLSPYWWRIAYLDKAENKLVLRKR
jgi:retron-type reverse transcriptase